MKELRISELMDSYRDDEFYPEGEQGANPDAVAARVLEQLPAAAPAKRKMPRRKKLFLAGALAAVLVVLVGAGFPYIQHQLVGGRLFFEQTADSQVIALVHYSPIMVQEGGRLYFVQDDQRLDITDLIDEDTPYLYDGSDPDSGLTYYLILGGTPECYGYLEWVVAPNPFTNGNGGPAPVMDGDGRVVSYDFMICDAESNNMESHMGGVDMWDGLIFEEGMDHPWLLAGLAELGIPMEEEAPPQSDSRYSYILE